jgi:hypothetical protein
MGVGLQRSCGARIWSNRSNERGRGAETIAERRCYSESEAL